MKWHFRRLPLWTIVLLAVWGCIIVLVAELGKVNKKQPHFNEKLRAAELAKRAMDHIRDYRRDHLLLWDPVSDPNGTGMIGEEYTIITTDRGELASKLTSTNPNIAALIVELLFKAGLKKGDRVAIAMTGSFPALNIAVLSAVETIGLRPTIISSLGSSMWGANLPEFTWLDMENLLYTKGILRSRSSACTFGGRNDIGANLSPEGRKALEESAKRNNIKLLRADNLRDMITRRMAVYGNADYKAYINIGGGLGSIGSHYNLSILGNGLIRRLPAHNFSVKGTMILFGERGIPIINIADIKELAQRYKFPVAPEPLPPIPSGNLFFREEYNLNLVWVLLISYIIIILFFTRVKKQVLI